MKKLGIASTLCAVIFLFSCGNSDEKARIQADSVAINAKPDSAINDMNNQNAHGGLPDSSSMHDSSMHKTDSVK